MMKMIKRWRTLQLLGFLTRRRTHFIMTLMIFVLIPLLQWTMLHGHLSNIYFPRKVTRSARLLVSTTASVTVDSFPRSPPPEMLSKLANMAKVRTVDCRDIFTGSENAIREAKKIAESRRKLLGEDYYINETANCTHFQTSRGYIMSSLTKLEEDFPIAYSILVYKDPEMIERLLRAIYRPQNYYCIHVEKKSPDDFYIAMERIARCFPNVFLATKRIRVKWGTMTVLTPELLCMEELWRYKKWKYFINLTGQEFPLKTNYELVKILTAYKGANDVQSRSANLTRWIYAGTAPHNIRPYKGSAHVALNRDFVDYVLHNKTAHDFLEWCFMTFVPDETYFTSLILNPHLGIKGSYTVDPESPAGIISSNIRYKMWYAPCAGRIVREICILSTGDLYRLGRAPQMFANKFFLEEDQVVIGCLEEKLFNDTRDEFMGTKTFETSYYENLNIVKYQIL